jgi:hypothetical protein
MGKWQMTGSGETIELERTTGLDSLEMLISMTEGDVIQVAGQKVLDTTRKLTKNHF